MKKAKDKDKDKDKDNLKFGNANQPLKKIPRQTKDFIPSNLAKYLRENYPVVCPQGKLNDIPEYRAPFQPFPLPQEWTYSTTDDVNKEIYSTPEGEIFNDPMHRDIVKHMPLSLKQATNNEMKWIRPIEYIKNNYIDKQIKFYYPKKKCLNMREDIKRTFMNRNLFKDNEENNVYDFLRSDSATLKKNIYKDFYNILEKKDEIKVINWSTREENDEEYYKRKEEEYQEKQRQEQILKAVKKVKVKEKETKGKKSIAIVAIPFKQTLNVTFAIEENERRKRKECNPSHIDLSCFEKKKLNSTQGTANTFCSWIASLFQSILDLGIKDATSGCSIFCNIYPQNDGIPVYNPSGRYIIKLYFMGKPRKIEIDDRFPCNKDEELILPHCEYLEEIWPAVLTKALIKLNMYKTTHPRYYYNEELSDPSYIYQLTGYHAEVIDLEKDSCIDDIEGKLNKILEQTLCDEVFLERKMYLLCYRQCLKNSRDNFCNEENSEEGNEKCLINHTEKIRLIPPGNDYISRNSPDCFKKFITQRNMKKKFMTCKLEAPAIDQLENKQTQRMRTFSDKKQLFSGKKTKEKTLALDLRRKSTEFSKSQCNSIFESEPAPDENILVVSKENVISNFAYSICEFFDNHTFNMNRLKPLDFSDLRERIKNSSMCFKKLSQSEKKAYLQSRRELKAKQYEEKLLRIEELKKDGKKVYLVKVKNGSLGGPKISSIIDYNDEEIAMANKCLLNDWAFPPPNFFEKYFEAISILTPRTPHAIMYPTSEKDGGEFPEEPGGRRPSKVMGFHHLNSYHQLMANKMLTPRTPHTFMYPISEKDGGEYIEGSVIESGGRRQSKGMGFNLNWNIETYLQLISNNVEQYFTQKEPIYRQSGGIWVSLSDFKKMFNRFILIQNTGKIYQSRMICDNTWYYYQTDTFEPLEEYNVLYLNSSPIIAKSLTYSVFIIFEPNTEHVCASKNKNSPYIVFDLANSQGMLIKENICLNNFYSTFKFHELPGSLDFYLIVKGGVFPLGYILQVFSEAHAIENMSHNGYLKKVLNYTGICQKIEHPLIEKNQYFLLARYCVTPVLELHDPGEVKVKISLKYPFKFIKPFVEVYCHQAKCLNKKRIHINEIIKLGYSTSLIPVSTNTSTTYDDFSSSRQSLKFIHNAHCNNNTYYITLSIKSLYTLKENSFEAEILFDNKNYKIEAIEHIDPYEVSDRYIPNRHGIIFKEYIYASDIVHCSLDVKLQVANDQQLSALLPLQSVNKSTITNEMSIKEQSEHDERIRMKLELYSLTNYNQPNFTNNSLKFSYTHTGELIYAWDFYTRITIHHMTLEGNLITIPQPQPLLANANPKKKNNHQLKAETVIQQIIGASSNIPYLLMCYLDLDEASNFQYQQNLGWTVRIFSSDSIGFVKDTSKEDHERSVKDSWGAVDICRAERARKARHKFLLMEKKEQGAKLTLEEENMLKEERERKSSSVVNEREKTVNIKEVPTKRILKNIVISGIQKKNSLVMPEQVEAVKRSVSVLIPKRALPVPESHKSDFIKEYLGYTYRDRTIRYDHNLEQSESKDI